MKKVFSKGKWLEKAVYFHNDTEIIRLCLLAWVNKLDGVDKEKCEKMGYIMDDGWCIEVPDEEG